MGRGSIGWRVSVRSLTITRSPANTAPHVENSIDTLAVCLERPASGQGRGEKPIPDAVVHCVGKDTRVSCPIWWRRILWNHRSSIV